MAPLTIAHCNSWTCLLLLHLLSRTATAGRACRARSRQRRCGQAVRRATRRQRLECPWLVRVRVRGRVRVGARRQRRGCPWLVRVRVRVRVRVGVTATSTATTTTTTWHDGVFRGAEEERRCRLGWVCVGAAGSCSKCHSLSEKEQPASDSLPHL
eukprot:scaffold72554_cov66-Phaeocystis_antarctica.AAC.5